MNHRFRSLGLSLLLLVKLLQLDHVGTVHVGRKRLIGHVKTVKIFRVTCGRKIRTSVYQAFSSVVLTVVSGVYHCTHRVGGYGDFRVVNHVRRQVHRGGMSLVTVKGSVGTAGASGANRLRHSGHLRRRRRMLTLRVTVLPSLPLLIVIGVAIDIIDLQEKPI